MDVLTVVCFLSSWYPLFAACSSFSWPGIPVWAGIQLIVDLCVNLDAASLMALVIVFNCSFLLLSVFTAVKESVCIVILSLVSLAFSSANCMAVILASSTDAESLSQIIISSPLCQLPPPSVSRHWNRRYSTCCCLVENGCILVISVSVFQFPP